MKKKPGNLLKNSVLTFLLSYPITLLGLILMYRQPILNKNLTTSIPNSVNEIVKITPTTQPAPESFEIPQKTHVFQTFNNCGPATLTMALSYGNIYKSQKELGDKLRPYQIAGGDNDDKSVTLKEIADEANNLGLNSYLRPNGDIEKLKKLLANNIPVVTRTWLHINEDIGHYRLVRGYNKTQILQDDSLQGANIYFSNEEFLKMWEPFNYEYLVLVDDSKKELVESILGDDLDQNVAWQNALKDTEAKLEKDPDNIHLNFAMSRIYYYLGNYEKSIEYFNKVETRLSFRALWYQIEPIEAIYETGDYDRLFSLTDRILNNQNRAFSELYYLMGKAYQNQGKTSDARIEYEKAVIYNSNNPQFQNALLSI